MEMLITGTYEKLAKVWSWLIIVWIGLIINAHLNLSISYYFILEMKEYLIMLKILDQMGFEISNLD